MRVWEVCKHITFFRLWVVKTSIGSSHFYPCSLLHVFRCGHKLPCEGLRLLRLSFLILIHRADHLDFEKLSPIMAGERKRTQEDGTPAGEMMNRCS